eukprot:COSAG05_NODE_195_length_14550_cov_203.233686_5_plen_96_part_00
MQHPCLWRVLLFVPNAQASESEAAAEAERARILAAPLARADALLPTDPYASRRVETLLWVAEAQILGIISTLIPPPPGGIVYSCMGAMSANIVRI